MTIPPLMRAMVDQLDRRCRDNSETFEQFWSAEKIEPTAQNALIWNRAIASACNYFATIEGTDHGAEDDLRAVAK